jgi:hypothetical protein
MKSLLTLLSAFIYTFSTAQSYCPPPFFTGGRGCIKSVSIASLYNSDPCHGTMGYLHSGAPTLLYRDSTYSLVIELDTITASTWFCVALPFDTSKNYFTANRFWHTGTTHTGTAHTFTIPLPVPATAIEGLTRMRIVRSASGTPIPCNTGAAGTLYGESQDYNIDIRIAPTPHAPLSVPMVASGGSIYPNPTSGIVNVPYGTATVINALGQVVYTSVATSTIDLTTLSNGTYYVKAGSQFATVTKQ